VTKKVAAKKKTPERRKASGKRPAVKKSAAKRQAKLPGEGAKPGREQQAAGSADAVFAALPAKQQQFVLEYLGNGFNAAAAARSAGYAKGNADTQGSRLLANPKVKAVLAERTTKITQQRQITAEAVLAEIAKMAFFDPRKLFRADGLIPITELGDEEAASIAGVEVIQMKGSGRGKNKQPGPVLKKIKIADKGMNLERLGRYLKLFTDKVEHTGVLGVQLITSVPRPTRPDAGQAPLRGVLDASRKDKD